MKSHATALCLTASLTLGCSSTIETSGQVFMDTAGAPCSSAWDRCRLRCSWVAPQT